ncbi:MAG: cyclic nucleotide-binding domain-containing protein [Deltaproteobacteria bacterium]|nr:cyclic nucleotide-binding domain-containing protein [Deltaproteobacteria bacterium]
MTGERDDSISKLSPLDVAHQRRLEGDAAGALRHALPMLESDMAQVGAAALICRVLIDADRSFVAGEVAKRLVDAFCRRGDLPAAVVAASMAESAGEDAAALHQSIAEVFGADSKRIGDVPPAPPPLPAADAKVLPATLKLEALLDRAETSLEKYLASDDATAKDSPVPRLPLFAKLAPEALAVLLAAFEVIERAEDDTVIDQGEEGREAFVVARGALRVVRDVGQESELLLAALGPGAIFGEMALVSDALRAASVIAVEPVILLAAGRDALESLAAREEVVGAELGAFCQGRMVSNLIRHSAILGSVPPDERRELVQRFQTRTFAPGEKLIERDHDVDGLYLVASGCVEVVGEDEDGDSIRIAALGPGDVVGEISLLLRREATADVVAKHPTVALWLEKDAFREVIREHPALLGELYETATRREEETRSVVAQEALELGDIILL